MLSTEDSYSDKSCLLEIAVLEELSTEDSEIYNDIMVAISDIFWG